MAEFNNDWKIYLPHSYKWLQSLKLETNAEFASNSFVLLCADAKSGELDAPEINKELKSGIEENLKKIGWSGGSGTYILTIDGINYTIIPKSGLNVTKAQIARQVGLDAAGVLSKLSIEKLNFAKSSELCNLEIFEGFVNGTYKIGLYKTDQEKNKASLPQKVNLQVDKTASDDVDKVRDYIAAQLLARFLQDAPSNYINPPRLTQIAADIASESKLEATILDLAELKNLGMGAITGVGCGSAVDPSAVIVKIPGKDTSKSVALIGKGVTFDVGGINIKPNPGMADMKYDMSGAAAVIGTIAYLAKHQPRFTTYCLVGAVENIPSGTALRPSDIVTAMNGKTIEVLNTDAEGRLVLADMNCYAVEKLKPDLIVNIATLTGAALMALGHVGGVVFGNTQSTVNKVLELSQKEGEPFWQLPLWEELKSDLKSQIADYKNTGGAVAKAGSIMGAHFLNAFTDGTDFIHLDIAGTAWNAQAVGYPKKTGTAFGFRTMVAISNQI